MGPPLGRVYGSIAPSGHENMIEWNLSGRQAGSVAGKLSVLIGFLAAVAGAAAADLFDGVDAASRPVMAAARQRIERIRKGDFTLRLVGPDGLPVHAQAEVRLVRHEFQFGANLSGFGNALPQESPLRARALQAVEDLFEAVELQNSWQNTEPAKDGPMVWTRTDAQVEWARVRQMPIRFHCLIYDFHYAIPKWKDEVKTTEAWWPLIERRIRTTAERYGNVIGEYNVINEMIMNVAWENQNNPIFPTLGNPTNGARMFHIARQYLPHAKLVSCEGRYAGASVSKAEFQEQYDYNQKLLQLGAPVDVIGYQGHFFALGNVPYQTGTPATPGAFTMKVINEGFDRLAGLGKPIHITEFTPPARSQGRPATQPGLTAEEIAAWTTNFYVLAFSKPAIEQVIWWQVIDGYGGRATDAGVLDKQGSPKPTYTALRQLLKREWNTDWKGESAAGAVSFRGFFGLYEARVAGFEPVRLWMRARDRNEAVIKLELGKEKK